MMDASLPSLTGIQVLVVDDHQDTRDLIEQVLTHADAIGSGPPHRRGPPAALGDVDIVEAN